MPKKHQKKVKRKLKIRSKDTVAVIAGDDFGVRGEVLRTYPEDGKVLVENVNVHYVHEKPGQRGRRQQGERVEKEMPVDVSNVMLICGNRDCNSYDRPVRVRRKKENDGSTTRLCAKCEHSIQSEV